MARYGSGAFSAYTNVTLTDVLQRAGGPKPDTYLGRVLISRLRPDSTREQLSATLLNAQGVTAEPHALAMESDFGADRVWNVRMKLAAANKDVRERIVSALNPLGIVALEGEGDVGTDVEAIKKAKSGAGTVDDAIATAVAWAPRT